MNDISFNKVLIFSRTQIGLMGTVYILGCIIGAIVFGFLADQVTTIALSNRDVVSLVKLVRQTEVIYYYTNCIPYSNTSNWFILECANLWHLSICERTRYWRGMFLYVVSPAL